MGFEKPFRSEGSDGGSAALIRSTKTSRRGRKFSHLHSDLIRR